MNRKAISTMVVAVAIVAAAAWMVIYLTTPKPLSDGYTAITTVTNQFFVGRAYKAPLSRFIELREPFLLQNTTAADSNTVTPQLFDLSVESYWLPKAIDMHVDNIVSKGAVDPKSPIAVKIKEYQEGRAKAAP